MKAWAIFSIENNYYQPDNNLVALYKDKPTFEQLLSRFANGRELGELEEYEIIGIVSLLSGGKYKTFDCEYRLEEVEMEE